MATSIALRPYDEMLFFFQHFSNAATNNKIFSGEVLSVYIHKAAAFLLALDENSFQSENNYLKLLDERFWNSGRTKMLSESSCGRTFRNVSSAVLFLYCELRLSSECQGTHSGTI